MKRYLFCCNFGNVLDKEPFVCHAAAADGCFANKFAALRNVILAAIYDGDGSRDDDDDDSHNNAGQFARAKAFLRFFLVRELGRRRRHC